MFDRVSVIIPIVRLEKAKRCIESIELHCPGVEIITGIDVAGIGCPKMVEKLTARTTRPIVVFLGDDTIVQAGAFQNALAKMESLPEGWGVVGFNTTPGNDHAHWMADKRILEHIPGGNFFSTEYLHCYGDDELKDIAIEQGRWAYADDAIIEHDHPVNGGESDEWYEKAYGGDKFKIDRATYFRRKRERKGGLLAIGFPLVNDTLPVQFFLSFETMAKPEKYTLLVPQTPHGPWTCNLAEARESLVFQALNEGASHLLMCDTDQVYPVDMLHKLASHGVDICGVRVHRRYPPFDPIFMRGNLDKYESVPESEMYSGNLIEVDATGTGCLLINMSVFDKLEPPWFKFDVHNGRPVGEDFYFCNKVCEAGCRIFIDTSVEVGHLVTMEANRVLHQICKQIKIRG